MKSHFFLFLFFISSTKAQNLIINEVSQGPSGTKEYVEFLVVPGSGPYQCSDYCLDLRGWIIDDNNGYFTGGGGSGLGIAAGAVRFSSSSFWSCVPIGTLILVYNDQDLNTALPSIDNSLTDGNCTLVLPISSTLFEHQTVSPTTSNGSYPTTGWSLGGLWGPITMANGGDSFQVYNPNNLTTPVHGVSWVNNNVNSIVFFSTTASNSVYYFANSVNNNPSNQANWVAGNCSAPDNQTPGAPNNSSNASYIQSLTNNCSGPLTATLSSSTDAGSCQCNGTATVSATGSIPEYSYQWFDATNTSIGQNSAVASNLCPGTYSCIVTSSINCTDTVFVTIISSTATITPTFTQVPPICLGGSFTLPTISTNNISGTWSPAINNSATTTYTFTPNTGQCANTSEMTVTVSQLITPTFNQLGPFCQGVTAPSLSNSSLQGISGVWGPPGINTGAVGTFNYVFVSNPGQCANNQTMTITVSPSSVPTFSSYGPFCEDAVLAQVLLPETSNNGISGTWNPAMLSTATPGINSYSFTPNPGQCAAVYNLTVEVFSAPLIDAGDNVTICTGTSIQLNASGGIQYSWTGGVQNGQTFQPAQSQVYFVTGTDANGCENSDSVIVTLVPNPTADFSADVNSGTAPLTVNFTNTSSNATFYNWNFGDGNEINTFDLSDVSNTFNNPGSYTVWLVASNGQCADSVFDVITNYAPDSPILLVPNVLTPNGDNANDEWFILSKNVAELEIIILNRWGSEITKIEGISGTWDGKTSGGDEATDGTYFYKYQAKGLNGDELSGHGFITLIR